MKTCFIIGVLLLSACNPARSEGFRIRSQFDDTVPFSDLLYQGVGATLRPGHSVEFFENGTVFDAMVEEIGKAKSSVNIVSYIWKKGAVSDRIIKALVERAEHKVACRVLVDAFGSPDWQIELKPLVEAGCEVRVFRPLPGVDLIARNHRKMVIIDGALAVTGGFGIRDNWMGNGTKPDEWRDSNVRIAGPAVREMQQAFAANWLEAAGQPLPEKEAFPAISAKGSMIAAFIPSTGATVGTQADRMTQLAILYAKKRVWISNAYFVPNSAIYEQMREKAKAGVDVRLITAGPKSDSKPAFVLQQGAYGGLRADGVKIWEYEPTMIHSKTMLVDDDLVIVGSINLDPLSLNRLEEGAVIVQDRALAKELEKLFLGDTNHSRAIE